MLIFLVIISLNIKFSALKVNAVEYIVLVLVHTKEGSIWSIALRCAQLFLLITQEVFLCNDGCAQCSYICAPAETQTLPINIFSSEDTLLDRLGFELMTF